MVLLLTAVAGVAWPVWWNHRLQVAARHLLEPLTSRKVANSPNTVGTTGIASSLRGCVASTETRALAIPRLGVLAPVQQGTSDTVLNVSVGHEPNTPWPGRPGESLLISHDVGYFAHLSALRRGDQIRVQHNCIVSVFTVTGHVITHPGALIDPAANGYGLALVTCWPPNALWWTSDRYVVTAQLTSTVTAISTSHPPTETVRYRPSLPGGVTVERIMQGGQSIGVGTLTVTGTPARAWAQSPAPLQAEHAALLSYFAGRAAVAGRNPLWWAAIAAPGVAMPASWPTLGTAEVTVNAIGTRLLSVTLGDHGSSLTVTFTGGTGRIARVAG